MTSKMQLEEIKNWNVLCGIVSCNGNVVGVV